MRAPRFTKGEWLIIVLCLIALVMLFLGGCSKREQQEHAEHQAQQVEKTTTTTEQPTILPDGQIVTLTGKQTVYRELVESGSVDRELHEQVTYPAAAVLVEAGAKIASGAIQASSGIGMGQAVGGGILALVTAATTAWAAHKTAEANSERRRADWHESDAADAYKRILPPNKDA